MIRWWSLGGCFGIQRRSWESSSRSSIGSICSIRPTNSWQFGILKYNRRGAETRRNSLRLCVSAVKKSYQTSCLQLVGLMEQMEPIELLEPNLFPQLPTLLTIQIQQHHNTIPLRLKHKQYG